MISITSLNSIKYEDRFYPDYALAYLIIKLFNLTPNDKDKIKEMAMHKSMDKLDPDIY